MIDSLSKKWPIIQALIILYFGFIVGKHVGFRDGVEIVEFDRNLAQKKISQCLRIIGEVK
jgi:hypothetical protein